MLASDMHEVLQKRHFIAGCGFLLLLLLIAKYFWTAFAFDMPLGYDPGIYRYLFLQYRDAFPFIPAVDPWALEQPPAFFLAAALPLKLLPVDWFLGFIWNLMPVVLTGVLAWIFTKREGQATGLIIMLLSLLYRAVLRVPCDVLEEFCCSAFHDHNVRFSGEEIVLGVPHGSSDGRSPPADRCAFHCRYCLLGIPPATSHDRSVFHGAPWPPPCWSSSWYLPLPAGLDECSSSSSTANRPRRSAPRRIIPRYWFLLRPPGRTALLWPAWASPES